jgi:predicted amidohydrolase YtcJ
MLNQTATRKFNVRTNSPPVLGGWFGKDMKAARWDGVVHEYERYRIFEMLPSDQVAEEATTAVPGSRDSVGVTSLTLIEPKPGRRLKMLSAVNTKVRVRVIPAPLTEGNRRLMPEYPWLPAWLSDRVSVSGVKWWLDGSPFERSCAMRAPYADDPGTSGQANFSPREIRAILEEAGQRDTQVLFHAVAIERQKLYCAPWRRQAERTFGRDGAYVLNTETASCPIWFLALESWV